MENERYKIVKLSDGSNAILDKTRPPSDRDNREGQFVCKTRSKSDAKMIFNALNEYYGGE